MVPRETSLHRSNMATEPGKHFDAIFLSLKINLFHLTVQITSVIDVKMDVLDGKSFFKLLGIALLLLIGICLPRKVKP